MSETSVTVDHGQVVYRMEPDIARELSFVLAAKTKDTGWQEDSVRLFEAADQLDAEEVSM